MDTGSHRPWLAGGGTGWRRRGATKARGCVCGEAVEGLHQAGFSSGFFFCSTPALPGSRFSGVAIPGRFPPRPALPRGGAANRRPSRPARPNETYSDKRASLAIASSSSKR